MEKNYTTSIVFDKEQYVRLTEIAYEERLGKKETLYRLLALGIKEYEKKNSL